MLSDSTACNTAETAAGDIMRWVPCMTLRNSLPGAFGTAPGCLEPHLDGVHLVDVVLRGMKILCGDAELAGSGDGRRCRLHRADALQRAGKQQLGHRLQGGALGGQPGDEAVKLQDGQRVQV